MSQKLKKLLSTILVLPILLVNPLISTDLFASQLIEGSDLRHVEVNVSAHEQNLLSIDGRRIDSIVPSQPIVYDKDEAAGAFYFFFPKEAGNSTVTLFVTDEQNPTVKYKLILVPKPIAGEDIIIKPVANKLDISAKRGREGRAFSYQRRAKDLILTMADDGNSDADFIAVNKVVPLWKEGRLAFLSKYFDGDMVGEKYRLTNVANNDMVLVEQELYRRGVMRVGSDSAKKQQNVV